MKSVKFILLFFFITFVFNTYAQDNKGTKPVYTGTVTSMVHVPSIASQQNLLPARVKNVEMKDGRASKGIVVPGKDPQTEDDFFIRNQNPLNQKIAGKSPSLVFDAYTSNSMPTDPSLAVGPNHVFVVFNTGFIIYDKAGNPLTGQISPNPTIFPNGGCCDLTVSYDNAADRWVVTFLGNGAQIAVSDGPDPVNDGWYTYTISQINDYQKLSVWSDGYYLTDNNHTSNKVWALERDEMLIGNPSAQIVAFNLPDLVIPNPGVSFYSPQILNVSDGNMPATGGATVLFLQDDSYGGVATDHIKHWTIDVDWVTLTNSTISAPTEIPATPFISVFDGGSFSNLPQPSGGGALDALQAIVMNQAQFRKFPTYNSAIFNITIDTDASSGKLAGIRWFEYRQTADNTPWTLYQEGTHIAPDGRHAWNASMIMDIYGNIGMGYTSMAGPTTANPTDFRASSYYTGRFAADPIGTMTITEELIADGTSNIPGTRYGDYAKIDIDPDDDKTFWFITEYYNGGRKGVVGAFKIAPDYNNDIGAINIDSPASGVLTNSEAITVTIFNYGLDAASNFDVSYQIDGGTLVTETFTGSIASVESAQFTFSATGDFSTEGNTYLVTINVALSGDEDPANNSVTQEITHLLHNDIGGIAIIAPISGNNMGMETITVSLQNFGGIEQSNFDVSYTLHGGAPVIEQVAGPLAAGATLDYSFTTQGDFTAIQGYNLSATTALASDSNTANDEISVVVVNSSCNSEMNNTSQSIGPDGGAVTTSVVSFTDDNIIYDVNVTINLNHTYDGDLDIYLEGPDGTRVELSTDNGSSGNDYIDTIFDDDATMDITAGSSPFTGSYRPEGNLTDYNGLSSLGDWTLEITDDTNGDGGILNFWSLEICNTTSVGIFDNVVDANDLIIKTLGDNHFEISLTSEIYTENLLFEVYNLFGQKIVHYVLPKRNGAYTYPLDMSYMTSGVYIIRLSNNNMGKVKRILVE